MKTKPFNKERAIAGDPVVDTTGQISAKKKKCYNCKFASNGFKVVNITYHQCLHPKHEPGFASGEITAWDTLMGFYDTCNTHEFKTTP